METFHEMYFDGDVDFNGDCLEVMELRHDWANFRFTIGLIKYFFLGMIPELIMHTRSQGKFSCLAAGRAVTSLPVPLLIVHASRQTRSKSVTTTTGAMTSTHGSWALA